MWIRRPSSFVLALLLCAGAAHADELDPLRERFRGGMEKYRGGAYAEAIAIWTDIYAKLGDEQGYRLAYNLARAFELSGDATRAAEHYEVYVVQVQRRRERGDALEANVEKQEADAAERLRELVATKGRIRIVGARGTFARVDAAEWRPAGFVAYVPPGSHAIVFQVDGYEHRVTVDVAAGDKVDVEPPPRREPSVEPRVVVAPPPAMETRREPPYPSAVLYIAAGVTAASVSLPAILHVNALSVRDDFYAASGKDAQDRLSNEYESARSTAYATYAVPAVLATVTLGLVAYYFLGARETKAPARTSAGRPLPSWTSLQGSF